MNKTMRFGTMFFGLCLSAGVMMAGEKGVMHCFAFTEIESATPDQWAAWEKATDELPGKVKGLKRVWHGKLARPVNQFQMQYADDAARKAFMESGGGDVKAKLLRRQHGACMEFADEAAFKAYEKDPAHVAWVAVYEKVRVAGTTTYQILAK